jgi:hypothetical protein
MPAEKKPTNLRQVKAWQRDAARAEYLRHPDASISEVVKATGVAERTVTRAREALVKEGLLAPGRHNTAGGADAVALAVAAKAVAGATPDTPPETEAPVAPKARGSGAGTTIDGEAMRKMNELLDELEGEDDDKTRERMLKQLRRFAFDSTLHPDTRMSASQLWTKLLDMKRAKDLGPGVPVTLAAAIERCTEFLRACGAKVAVPAFYAAFDLGDPDAHVQDTQAVDEGQPSPAPPLPAGPPDNDTQAPSEA